jgi:prepilin-type N-terminal cleavage/methylation domain-containing protein
MTRIRNAVATRLNGQEGFSIIEVMVAAAVFAIIALALAAQASHTINTNASARRMTAAAVMASNQVEHLYPQARRYNGVRLSDGIHNKATGHTIATDAGYEIQYEVRTADALPRTKTVRVTVTWIEKGGLERSVDFNYLLPEIL